MKERWRDVVGYEGRYEVSERGRIFSVSSNTIRHLRTNEKGYKIVALYDGRRHRHHRVHRLVADAFVPNPKQLPHVLHVDDDPGNNRYRNLTWGTNAQNVAQRQRRDRHARGSGIGTSVLTEKEVKVIVERLQTGYTQSVIAAEYGVLQSTISDIKRGVSWAHVTGLGS